MPIDFLFFTAGSSFFSLSTHCALARLCESGPLSFQYIVLWSSSKNHVNFKYISDDQFVIPALLHCMNILLCQRSRSEQARERTCQTLQHWWKKTFVCICHTSRQCPFQVKELSMICVRISRSCRSMYTAKSSSSFHQFPWVNPQFLGVPCALKSAGAIQGAAAPLSAGLRGPGPVVSAVSAERQRGREGMDGQWKLTGISMEFSWVIADWMGFLGFFGWFNGVWLEIECV